MISVIIPIHNKLPHLDRSVQSVLSQSFKEFELLLIDDASTDGSSDLLDKYKDPRIRVFRRETSGAGGYAARNLGIQEAKYDWISFLDADDEWSSLYLEKVVSVIRNHNNVEFVSTGWEKLVVFENFPDLSNIKVRGFDVYDYLIDYKLAWTGAVNIKKDLLLKVGAFPSSNLKCKVGGDIDTWIRCLSESNYNLNIVNIMAYYYQDTVNQVTNACQNPTTYFCAYNTVKTLYDQSHDKTQRQIIRNYINSKIIQILRRPQGFELSLVAKMYPTFWGIKSLVKVLLIKINIMK